MLSPLLAEEDLVQLGLTDILTVNHAQFLHLVWDFSKQLSVVNIISENHLPLVNIVRRLTVLSPLLAAHWTFGRV